MINCDKIVKLEIEVVNPDGTTGQVVKYIDTESNEEVTANQVISCNNIPSINIDCAKVCD